MSPPTRENLTEARSGCNLFHVERSFDVEICVRSFHVEHRCSYFRTWPLFLCARLYLTATSISVPRGTSHFPVTNSTRPADERNDSSRVRFHVLSGVKRSSIKKGNYALFSGWFPHRPKAVVESI